MKEHFRHVINRKVVNAVVGYVVSLTLTGVSPYVCESLLDTFLSSVRKSKDQLLHR
jgi:hypothetical protein